MKLQRSLGVLAVFLVLCGSADGIRTGTASTSPLERAWEIDRRQNGCGPTRRRRKSEGAGREGRGNRAHHQLKKSSNPAVYPKRKIQIPREVVSRIEARSSIKARPTREGRTDWPDRGSVCRCSVR